MSVVDRHAVITGGSRGIGAAIAKTLSRQGARVTLMGRSRERLEARAAEMDGALAVPCDVTDQEAVESAFTQARKAQGAVDILVNNAGQATSLPFMRTDRAHFQSMLDVNFLGAYLCTHCALPDMLGKGEGRVVNIASTAALKGYAYVSAYTASKHALVGLTRALAAELAGEGVTVNAVCPGYTETDMLEEAVENIASKTGRAREEVRSTLERHNPQHRFIQPEEVAGVVLWLCLPSSRSITGQAIAVAGGEIT